LLVELNSIKFELKKLKTEKLKRQKLIDELQSEMDGGKMG
jgi:hypothetical protein